VNFHIAHGWDSSGPHRFAWQIVRHGSVKLRPDSTTSERQLVQAMATTGRPVTLADLANWRKDGLLPPLASHGLGPGKGKSYYWREENILTHACAAFDLLGKYGRPDTVTWMLWLCGFCVPLPQLRRAWAHRCKSRRPMPLRPAADPVPALAPDDFLDGFETAGGLPCFLLNVVLKLGASLAPDRDGEAAEMVALLRRLLARVMRPNHADGLGDAGLARQLWQLIRIVGSVLETSELVAETKDTDLQEAQRHLCAAARLLQECSIMDARDDAHAPALLWPPQLAEQLGPPLFVLILVLLRSGHRGLLEDATRDLGGMGRQNHALPAQPSYLHA